MTLEDDPAGVAPTWTARRPTPWPSTRPRTRSRAPREAHRVDHRLPGSGLRVQGLLGPVRRSQRVAARPASRPAERRVAARAPASRSAEPSESPSESESPSGSVEPSSTTSPSEGSGSVEPSNARRPGQAPPRRTSSSPTAVAAGVSGAATPTDGPSPGRLGDGCRRPPGRGRSRPGLDRSPARRAPGVTRLGRPGLGAGMAGPAWAWSRWVCSWVGRGPRPPTYRRPRSSPSPRRHRPGLARRRADADPRPGRPSLITLPSLAVQAPVVPVRLVGGGLTPPSDPTSVGWWAEGALPGARRGSALLVGHTVHTGGVRSITSTGCGG